MFADPIAGAADGMELDGRAFAAVGSERNAVGVGGGFLGLDRAADDRHDCCPCGVVWCCIQTISAFGTKVKRE